jgi:hypothetical protein
VELSSRHPRLATWRASTAPRTGRLSERRDLIDRRQTAQPEAVSTAAPGPAEGFLGQLDWMLGRLRAARVRITFARIELRTGGGAGRRAAERIAEELDDAFGLAGMMPDGSVLAAFFGPRQPGGTGDREQSQAIVRRLEEVLRDAAGVRAAADATVFMIHRWTDEIGDVPTLMLEATAPRAQAVRLELVPA